MYQKVIKRFFDIIFSLIALIILSPLLLLVSVILLIVNRGKILFIQERIGMHDKPFFILKFKSMNDRKDSLGKLLPNEIRLTPFGKFIRKTSLDELPQLINVLIGNMSFIGPRPLHKRYLPYYSKEEQKRHLVRPGITGLAQVSGRNLMEWDDKLKMDIEYVDSISFSNDLQIFLKTFYKVFRSSGVVMESLEGLDEYRSRMDQKG